MNKDIADNIRYYVLIPAYNEGVHLKKLLEELKKYTENILIVEDGSSDNTLEIIKNSRVDYLIHETNQGKGASLSDGYRYLTKKDIDYVLTMDADGQHAPSEILKFIECAQQTGADIIIGSRMANPKDMPLIRYITNKFTSWIISRLCGQSVPDSQCGYRMIHKKVLESVNVETKNFDAESEILVKAANMGYTIASASIKSIYHGTYDSKINPVVDTIRFFKLIIRLSKVKKELPE